MLWACCCPPQAICSQTPQDAAFVWWLLYFGFSGMWSCAMSNKNRSVNALYLRENFWKVFGDFGQPEGSSVDVAITRIFGIKRTGMGRRERRGTEEGRGGTREAQEAQEGHQGRERRGTKEGRGGAR